MNQDRKFYVYVHRRKSDGRIFYVGKGSGHRHSTSFGRNKYWQRVAQKYDWYSEIVFSNLDNNCSFSIERMLIFCLKSQITNISDGGEGPNGFSHTDSAKLAMSIAKKGKPKPPRSLAHRAAISAVHCVPVHTNLGEFFASGKSAAEFLRCNGYPTASRGNISSCANGKMKSCYGRKWFKTDIPK